MRRVVNAVLYLAEGHRLAKKVAGIDNYLHALALKHARLLRGDANLVLRLAVFLDMEAAHDPVIRGAQADGVGAQRGMSTQHQVAGHRAVA